MRHVHESIWMVRESLRRAAHRHESYFKIREGLRRAVHGSEMLVRHAARLDQSHRKLIGDAQHYWNNPKIKDLKQSSHWRGAGIFNDEGRWLTLGREHFCLYETFARAVDFRRPLRQVVEWGCGGGTNAVQFASADSYCGVDISAATLEECQRQMASAGAKCFIPVLIDVAHPEAALSQIPSACDLFLSTYVFEILPTPEYGMRVLKIAYQVLAPGSIAIIQIKYHSSDWRTRSRRWGYGKNLAWNATYGIDEFWTAAAQCGFTPRMITLVPVQPLVSDRNYAYFLLQRPLESEPCRSN
jgi:SAM-dependent methyltransferase